MREYTVHFERDPELDGIELVVRAPSRDAAVDALLEELSGNPPDTLTVFSRDRSMQTIRMGEIVSASVDGKLVHIVTESGSWYTRQTLQGLEATLEGRQFMRISRYEIVNLDKVLRYDFTLAGTLRLELVGGMETWAARRCIPAIRRRLLGKE